MIKIQMAPERDGHSDSGIRTRDFMWMIGNNWPVEGPDNNNVVRVEAFGPELDFVKHFPGGETDVQGVRCWYRKDAAYIANQMEKLVLESGQREA